jgi:23S rRNA pseudouridine1911/1915/1917 synthase
MTGSETELADYIENNSPDRSRRFIVPPECAGLRLDQALARLLPEYSRSRLQEWLRSGHIRVNGANASPKDKVWGGEMVLVEPQAVPGQAHHLPEDIPLDVVFEDDELLVINKPVGLVVHPGSGNWSGTLLNALLRHVPELARVPRAGIVHRLDKDTSGLLVIARTLTAQTDLVRQLQARTVNREYLAVVRGAMPSDGVVETPIGRHPVNRTRMAVVARGKPARTWYAVMERGRNWTLVRCRLDTGRTHQIRVHLHSIGFPLVGDPLYGQGKRHDALPAFAEHFPRQALHAQRLALVHPRTGEPMSWEAPLPADIGALLEVLRNA